VAGAPQRQSALVVVIPEAETAVGALRARLDPSARVGVPAHVTVTFPFAAAPSLGEVVLDRLDRLFGAIDWFEFSLDRTGWFGAETVWLGPRDPVPFRDLTDRVFAEFPDHPPFGGQFDEVIPHLTVGHQQPVADLRAAEEAVRPYLPIEGTVRAVSLLVEQPGGRWQRARTFGLAVR
jgi:2'-5' RNA ligase